MKSNEPDRQAPPERHLATLLSAACADAGGSITPPIVQSSLFSFDSYDAFEDRMAGRSTQPIYSRVQNPTVQAFESLLAQAERAEAAVGFASGMGAISGTVLALVKPGDRIACVEHVYPDAYRLFELMLRPFGVAVDYYPVVEFETNPDLLQGVAVAYLESPNSLLFQTLDLGRVAAHAKRHGTLTVIDNSWSTPVFQQPLLHGIDIVLHSASKYLSGHSDTVAGVVAARHPLIDRIRELTLPLLGAKLAPFEAWLLVRGMRTLVSRMHSHRASTEVFIERLADLPGVGVVHSPAIAGAAGPSGRAGLLSVQFDRSVNIKKFADSLRLFKLGVSWGGFESLVLPARVGLAQAGEANSMQRFGVPDTLIRISIGLEHVEDLWADFESALKQSRS